MILSEIAAISIYLLALFAIALATYKDNLSSSDFIIGGRSMNFWITALAAHASDMSSWIFMGYPVFIYTHGIQEVWIALGLTFFMWINWQFIAKKLRLATEKYQAMTFSSFFESRLHDTSGHLRIITALISLCFYTIYISASFTGLGLLLETLFQIPYSISVILGAFIVVPYLFISGYVTLAWTDFFQGLFLLLVIVIVPIAAFHQLDMNWTTFLGSLKPNFHLNAIVSSWTFSGFAYASAAGFSWGLGYFGQPHIVTKFMGIKDPTEIIKSKWFGMSWQITILLAATWIGIIATVFFKSPPINNELIFIKMTQMLFSPFVGTFILCAIVGATMTHADSQLLILASTLAEDFYKRAIRKDASSKEILIVSRLSIVLCSCIAIFIALFANRGIMQLVTYAWFGLGASFGPLLIMSLYSSSVHRYGAYAGVIVGGATSGLWPLTPLSFIPSLLPAFTCGLITIYCVSRIARYQTTFNS